MEIKQILYINKIRFICDAVQKTCARNEVECFTLEDTNDFAYLIDDLKPAAVVIEEDTFNEGSESFWSQIESANESTIPVIMGTNPGKFDVEMSLPLDMMNFVKDLSSKLAGHIKKD
jgi:hypothetical protein